MAGSSFCSRVWVCGVLAGMGAIIAFPTSASAQVVADSSIGTSVEPFNAQIDLIKNGARSANGENLFHSFQEFNIGSNRAAYFVIPDANVLNILARVTGGNPSQILGILGTRQQLANGGFTSTNANLFLMNPSGIIFGQGAQLDVGGSFLATTANAIQFGDRGVFRASLSDSPSQLLTVEPSALLFDQINIAPIQSNSASLVVGNGQSLLLLGGDVILDNSFLGVADVLGGRAELGGLAAPGKVNLTINDGIFNLSFPSNILGSDVTLKNGSQVNVIAGSEGSIAVHARNLNILDGSSLVAGIGSELGSTNSQADDITVSATGDVTVKGNSEITNNIYQGATGQGGNLTVESRNLTVSDGAQLSAVVMGTGNAGNVNIKVQNDINLDGGYIFSGVGSSGEGDGGNVVIQSDSLQVLNGASLNSNTFFGFGNGGNVVIRATNRLVVDGVSPNGFSSEISSSTVGNGGNLSIQTVGNGGNISIQVGEAQISNGGKIDASTIGGFGQGGDITIDASNRVLINGASPNGSPSNISSSGFANGGNVRIRAGDLLQISSGGQLITNTAGRGNSGNILVNTRNAIDVSGSSSDGIASQIATFTSNEGEGGNILIETKSLRIADGATFNAITSSSSAGGNVLVDVAALSLLSGGQLRTTTLGSGQTGKVTINVKDSLLITGRNAANDSSSGLFVSFTPSSAAGEIEIKARTAQLDKQGQIIVSAPSGNGGNLTLNLQNLLLLRHRSLISASAGAEQSQGNGGNISINVPKGFVVAPPEENSDIIASATEGRGGNVNISTQGIFGLKLQPKLTPRSDITASSAVGLSGTITLNSPDTTFIQNSLTQLSQSLTDPNTLLAGSCIVRNRDRTSNGSFLITGSDSLPYRPGDAPPASFPTGEVRSLPNTQSQRDRPWQPGDAIVEPQGIYRLPNGKLVMSRECEP